MTNMTLWQPENNNSLINAKTPTEISNHAVQLSAKDKSQIVSAFDSGHYEIAVNYLWVKTIAALKKELATVGVSFLGEMLGKPDVDEDEDVDNILTTRDAIRLAEELFIITSTDGMRLRNTYELISHFSQMEVTESDSEEIHQVEAMSSLIACVSGVLSRPKIEVAKKFVEFRNNLEGTTLSLDHPHVEMLKSSPYFFNKLAISVLMNATKKNTGANLEHTLANINVIVPAIWANLRDTEKWQVGHAYAEAYADGKSTVVGGLKSALLKVKGFDFVPENLRSNTFLKAAKAIIDAHDNFNNFYNEPAPVKNLSKLGTTIPTPALPVCITALLCVVLGNYYGVSTIAKIEASEILKKITPDRWAYYLNNAFPSDTRILTKILDDKPLANWIKLVEEYNFHELAIKDKDINSLLSASNKKEARKIQSIATKILEKYYGKTK
ncbi:MAG: hypothetical protein WAX77_06880 [Methylococcaceae bacterium]